MKVPALTIHMVVDRCHVMDSHLAVARYLLSRFQKGAFWALPRGERRAILQCAMKRHTDNRNLFRRIQKGLFV